MACLCPALASAQMLYWDRNGATAGSGNIGGDWTNALAHWSTAAAGNIATVAWSAGNTAVFSAGTDGAGPFNVRITTGTTIAGVNGLRFEEGSVSVTGQNATTSILTLTGGTIDTVNANVHTLSARLSGSVGLDKQGVGTLVLGNTNNNFTGNVTLSGGTLRIASDAHLGDSANDLVFNGGTLETTANLNFNSGRVLDFQAGGGTIAVTGGTLTLDDAGQLAGAGSFEKSGAGTLFISAANTGFTGDAIVSSGTLRASTADALGASGAITLGHGATYRADHFAGQAFIDRIHNSTTGTLALDRSAVTAIDLSNAGGLRLGSSVTTGTGIELGGAITPSAAGYFFGGGGGRLNINTPLSGSGGLGVAESGHVVLQGPHSYTGATTVRGSTLGNGTTTLELSNANAVAASPSITVTGATVGTFGGNTASLNTGALLLHPAFTYTGAAASPSTILLDNGAIGWNADKTLAALPGVFSTNTVLSDLFGTPTVTGPGAFTRPAAVNTQFLHLGGPLSAGTMTANFVISDNGATPVALIKSGFNSTLDLRPAGAHTHTGGTAILSGTVVINQAAQLSSAPVSINAGGTLRVADTDGNAATAHAVNLAQTLKIYSGSSTNPEANARINVDAGVTATFSGAIDTSYQPRSIIRKDGAGHLVLDFLYQPFGSPVTQWGLSLGAGMTTINQNPWATATPSANGTLLFDGGDLTVKPWTGTPTQPAQSASSYGFEALSVTAGTVGRVYLQDDARLQFTLNTSPTWGNIAGHLIIDAAPGSTLKNGVVAFTSAGSSNQGMVGSGILELREGSLLLATGGNGSKRILPAENAFTLALNGGFLDTLNPGNMSTLSGHFIVNASNRTGGDAPEINRFSIESATSTANDAPFAGTYASTGDTRWYGDLNKVGAGTFSINRTGGAVVVENDPTLRIVAGTVIAGGAVDIFTDSFDASRHVNADLSGATASLQITGSSKTLGRLDGVAGSQVSVASGLTLSLDHSGTADFGGAVTGAGSVALTGSGTQTLSGTNTFAGNLSVTGGELRVTGSTAHAGATVVDAATLTLAGAGALTATSGIQVSNTGVLVLDNTASNSANRIADSVGVALGVGTLRLLGNASAATSETVGNLTVNPGASFVEVVRGGAQTASLTLGGWTANTGGTVEFAGGTGALGGPERVFITGGLGLLVNGIIPYATVGGQLATYDATLGVVASSSFANDININLASANVRLDASSTLAQRTLTNAGVTTDNSLTLSDGVSVDLNTATTRTLNLFSGGLAVTDGASTISGSGRLTAGGMASRDLSVFVNAGAGLTINSVIQNNAGGGVVSLVKSGDGTLILGGANTHTGNTFINQGVLAINSTARLGAAGADVIMSGGTLATYGANLSFTGTGASLKEFFLTADTTNTFDIAGNAFDTTNRSLTLGAAGNLAGSGTLVKTGGGTLIVSQANTAFSGDVLVNRGTLELRAADALGAGATKSHITLAGGTRLNLRANASADFGNDVRLTGNAVIDTRRISGSTPANQTLSLGTIEIGAHTLTTSGSNNYSLAADRVVLTGAANFNISTSTSPFIVTGELVGEHGFTKSGAGVLRLDGAATNTGTITVTAGTLRLGAAERIRDTNRLQLTGGTLDLAGFTETIGSLSGAGTVATNGGTLRVGGDNTSATYTGAITGTDGSFVKQGTGTLTFSGSATNTNTGDIRVDNGTLVLVRSSTDRAVRGNLVVGDGLGAASSAVVRLDAANQITNTSAVTVRSDGLLDFNTRSDTIGALAFEGGRVSLTTATLTVAGGVSSLASASSARLEGGTLALGAGAKTFTIADGAAAADLTITSRLTGSGEIQKLGDGRLVLDATNTGFTGDVRIDAGTLAFGRSGTFAIGNDFVLNGGTLELNNTTHTLGDMHVTADSILEFSTVSSWLQVGKLVIDEGVTLTVNNWTAFVDHFCVRDPSELVLNRIIFAGFDASATRLFGTSNGCFIVTPIPEPGTYGAVALGGLLVLTTLRRRRRSPVAGANSS